MSDIVIIETNLGNIEITLNVKDAPISTENFKHYVSTGFYDGVIFHRVIKGFMIQTGGFLPPMSQKEPTKPSIKNEADNLLKNDKYTVAMARTNDIDSATSQFFINVGNNDFLNHGVRDFGYAVFGKVTAGNEIVDKIALVTTKIYMGMSDVPVEQITIKKAYFK